MGLLFRLMPKRVIEKRYIQSGIKAIGDVVDYSLLSNGGPNDFLVNECLKDSITKWVEYESEYARRGYNTISMKDMLDIAGGYYPADRFLGDKIKKDEEPVYHARNYMHSFLEECLVDKTNSK